MIQLKPQALATAGAVALSIIVTAPAWGQSGGESFDVVAPADPKERYVTFVAYDDLNLTTERGEKKLRSRVRTAAHNVCPINHSRTGELLASKCRREARVGAEPQIALAVTRARQLAQYGSSDIPPVQIALKIK
jgi:UrcA family protein